jgi:hypothetical protein
MVTGLGLVEQELNGVVAHVESSGERRHQQADLSR